MLDGKSGGILLHGLPNPTPTETVWTGSQFVLIWRERGPDGAIKGATLRPDVLLARQQLDPVTIAEDPTGAFSLYYETADAVNTPEGLVIAYTRTGGDEVGGVQRVFTRMALAPTNRSRATRR